MCGPFDTASPLGPGMDAISVPSSGDKEEEKGKEATKTSQKKVDVVDNLAQVCSR